MKLLISAILKFLIGILLIGALLFVPAGTFLYPNAWLLLALLFVPILLLGAVLYIKAPALLEKRLNSKEKEGVQKGVLLISALLFIAGFVVAGLDFRFGWSHVHIAAVIVACIAFLGSYAMYALVMRQNQYLSRTIEVREGQSVVDTGLYGIVRHPMYLAVIILFYSMPIALGSLYSLACFLPFVVLLAVRIVNEERVLTKELPGYTEYKRKVKYRLIPFIW